ncbi:MAG: hypothetical protein JRM99_08490 [Nitrososphaerota archaeon]|nr:hypothetical protein [Nitrososphaerota archaeon]
MLPTLLKDYTKGILSNRNLWFWGVAFMLFWLVLGAFEFSQAVPRSGDALLSFTSSWYGVIALYSLSSLAISIAYTIYYASSALAYGFRYTRLTPASYIGTLMGSSSALGVVLSAIMLVATYGLFSWRFGTALVPSDPLGAVAVSAMGGVFMMGFAMLLVLVVVNYVGLRSINLVTFVPLILAFGLGYSQLLSSMPQWLLYSSPYNAIQSLLYLAYSGTPAPVEFTNPTAATLDWPYLVVSLVAWIAALLLADSVLLRRLRPRQVEEGRQI